MTENSTGKTTEEHWTRPMGNRSHSRIILIFGVLLIVGVGTFFLMRGTLDVPEDATVQDTNGRVTPEQQAEQTQRQIDHLHELYQGDTTNLDVIVALANSYFDAQMPDQAIIYYRKALRLAPGNLPVKTDLATMLRQIGESKEAVAILEEVVAVDSVHPQALFNLGVICAFDLKDNDRAIAYWRRFIAVSPHAEVVPSLEREIQRMQGTPQ